MKLAHLLLPLAFAASLPAQDLREFEKRVTEFTLPNGLHFIVLERHEAPVVSFHTYVNAGSVDDPKGKTGLAHMFEHMAFKGTETIGTKNSAAEKQGAGRSRARLRPARRRAQQGLQKPIPQSSKNSRQQLDAAIEKADSYVDPESLSRDHRRKRRRRA